MSSLKRIDEEKLIDMVRSRRCIHDKSHSDYKNIIMKEATWREISEAMGKDTQVIKAHWTKLRTQYMGFLRRLKKPLGSESGLRPYFRHEHALSFLKDSSELNERNSSNFDVSDIEVEEYQPEINQIEDLSNLEIEIDIPKEPAKNYEDSLNPGSKKKMGKFEKELLKRMCSKNPEDELQLYARMLTAKLRKISQFDQRKFLKLQFDLNALVYATEMECLE